MERPGERRRELVYCHQCENEWYQDEHGLQCPQCEGDFVEVVRLLSFTLSLSAWTHEPLMTILWTTAVFPPAVRLISSGSTADTTLQVEPQSDPRVPDPDEEYPLPMSPFATHNPWPPNRSHPGPSPDPFGFFRAPPPDMRPPTYAQQQNPMSGLFNALIAGMNNTNGRPFPAPSQNRDRHRSPSNDRPTSRPRSAPGYRDRDQAGRPHVEVFTNSGPGFSFTATTSSFGGGGPRSPGNPFPGRPLHYDPDENPNPNAHFTDLFGLLNSITGAANRGNPADPHDRNSPPPNPFDFLTHLINPSHAPAGDFATSQEAFDRIISELMQQHQSGSAPGPAAEEAIAALPRMTVTDRSNPVKGDGDCSICMASPASGDTLVRLPCHHWFHDECASSWLHEHDTCPICREGIMPKDGGASPGQDEQASRETPPLRSPGQPPLHNQDPFHLARRQSGSRSHPFLVPESPTRDRRDRPSPWHAARTPRSHGFNHSDANGYGYGYGFGRGTGAAAGIQPRMHISGRWERRNPPSSQAPALARPHARRHSSGPPGRNHDSGGGGDGGGRGGSADPPGSSTSLLDRVRNVFSGSGSGSGFGGGGGAASSGGNGNGQGSGRSTGPSASNARGAK